MMQRMTLQREMGLVKQEITNEVMQKSLQKNPLLSLFCLSNL